MGQVESTIFDDAPPWDMKMILKLTQLQEEEVNFCWKKWATNPSTKKGKIDSEAFKELFEIADDDDKEAKKLFKILDFDDDERIEFPELMLYIFSTEENLSRELKLKRSYNFYDNNGSGKISQEEMVEALGLVHDIEPRILNLRILISFFHENDFYNEFFVYLLFEYFYQVKVLN